MATFTHIFSADDRVKIAKNGITVAKVSWRKINGVFLSPVTGNYYYTHQWKRELKRWQNVPKLAVRVRLHDDEKVFVGKYNEEHIEVSASEAIKIALNHKAPGGLEVILPRSVKPKELMQFYKPNENVGWRYRPDSNSRKPCWCFYCQRGEPYSSKRRKEYEADDS
ncbi:hypothetical protein [Rubellicoccus peritrichatus]|uniref:Uncharacterized protein n=1 Tax=Rubellicoccus peritrichatus TaxID=3080537 RepID=A0AAQ3L7W9_9BACT|nr:hypothetical protein [Puniceicoccus sp. CR14]WOO40910.1 hypothetical protein RZN69_19990 [Puniceicoccus sp. CR14]